MICLEQGSFFGVGGGGVGGSDPRPNPEHQYGPPTSASWAPLAYRVDSSKRYEYERSDHTGLILLKT